MLLISSSRITSICFILMYTLLTGCGGGSSSTAVAEVPVAKTIVAATGGTVSSSQNKLKISIPAGALMGDTEVTITPVTVSDLPAEFSNLDQVDTIRTYELGPSGTVFNSPITITFEDKQTLTQPDGSVQFDGLYAIVTSDGINIEGLSNITLKANLDDNVATITGELSHFSPLLFAKQKGTTGTFNAKTIPDSMTVGDPPVTISSQFKDSTLPSKAVKYIEAVTDIQLTVTSPLSISNISTLSGTLETNGLVSFLTKKADYSCSSAKTGIFKSTLEVGYKTQVYDAAVGYYIFPSIYTYEIEQSVECIDPSAPAPISDPLNDCFGGSGSSLIDCLAAYADIFTATLTLDASGNVDVTIETAGDLPALIPAGETLNITFTATNESLVIANLVITADSLEDPTLSACNIVIGNSGEDDCSIKSNGMTAHYGAGACFGDITIGLGYDNGTTSATDTITFPSGKICEPPPISGVDLNQATTIFTKSSTSGCLNDSDNSAATGCPLSITEAKVYETGEGPSSTVADVHAGFEFLLNTKPNDGTGPVAATLIFTNTDASQLIIEATIDSGITTCLADGNIWDGCRFDGSFIDFFPLDELIVASGKTPDKLDARINFMNGPDAAHEDLNQFGPCVFGGWTDILPCQ